MKFFKNIFLMCICLSLIAIPQTIYAQDERSFTVSSYSTEDTTFAYTVVGDGSSTPSNKAYAYIGRKLSVYSFYGTITYKDGIISGNYEWEDSDYVIKEGEQTVTIKFVNFYDRVWTAEIYLYGIKDPKVKDETPIDIDAQDVTVNHPEEETTTPTLTATTLIMSDEATYDINVNDKIADSTYAWTSSNTKVAKVNAKTGVVTAVADGSAKVTCKITTPESETITLTSTVTVGDDEDYPSLNDNDIELSVSDKFDVNVENQVAKSQYRYVSSDKTIATVNASNGIITAKKVGTAVVRCIITSPNGETYVLKCDVTVTE